MCINFDIFQVQKNIVGEKIKNAQKSESSEMLRKVIFRHF